MYGRGPDSIAEQIGTTKEEAQKIIDDFYSGFPSVKEWVQKTEEDAIKNGYVEDLWGRRRRLPDIQLPKFEIKLKNDSSSTLNVNPIPHTKGIIKKQADPRIKKYLDLLNNARGYREIQTIKSQAIRDDVQIFENTSKISEAKRQSVNARVQGGASTMTKIAMRKIYDDKELRELGFKLLITVHD